MKALFFASVVLSLAVSSRPAVAGGTANLLDGVDQADVSVGSDDVAMGKRVSERLNDISSASSQLGSVASGANTALGRINAITDMFQALSDLDSELDSRRTSDDGAGPEIPSSCAGRADGACSECFAKAYGEVNFTRNTLERLRTIHKRTIAFIKRAEGFGDSVSGIHGVSGLSWQYAKMDIEKARTKFNRTSRDKYEALIRNMKKALDMVSECEAKHFNNPDWYNRFGFMYYNFVKEAYAPSE
jgi:hypothetical protein